MKRGSSGLSLCVGVDKPAGMTSHDAVGACRRIFGERRVGHTGTLDPMATGVLPVLVGSATRLSSYLTGHDKVYEARIAFGASTDTDDAQGEVVRERPVPPEVGDTGFALSVLGRFTGAQKQIPPVYSALKRGGKKACDEARKGNVIELDPRDIAVHDARLLRIDDALGPVTWDVRFAVSKGTYIRSLARDIGRACGTEAHLSALRRVASGSICIDECVSLETLTEVGSRAALDPVRALGYAICFVSEEEAARVRNGQPLPFEGRAFHAYETAAADVCACTSGVRERTAPADGDLVSIAAADKLLALYRCDDRAQALKAECVFSEGVSRGRSA